MKTKTNPTAVQPRNKSRTGRKCMYYSVKAAVVGIIVMFCVCVQTLSACACERKGPTAGFGMGLIPYAGTGSSYSGVSISGVSLSISLGYAFTNQQVVALYSELSLTSNYGQPSSFAGPVFSHYFSPNDRSGFLSIGIGRTFTSHSAFLSSHNKYGPAVYLGGGYMFRKHYQVSAGISIGSVDGVSKRYLSLTVSAIAF